MEKLWRTSNNLLSLCTSPYYWQYLFNWYIPFRFWRCAIFVFSVFRGKGEPVTELSWSSCRQLLYQSMATILAHTGFECANESVLETLTDIAHEYCLKFTKLLRFAVDREARLGHTPFPDVMEQVFHEVGIGSVLSLQKFWQHRIKDYHSYMLQVRRAVGTWQHQ